MVVIASSGSFVSKSLKRRNGSLVIADESLLNGPPRDEPRRDADHTAADGRVAAKCCSGWGRVLPPRCSNCALNGRKTKLSDEIGHRRRRYGHRESYSPRPKRSVSEGVSPKAFR